MAGSNIREQDRSYRRGVVLGLTMAELVLLLLFVLLLALASALAQTQADLQQKSEELAEAKKAKVGVEEKLARALLIIEERENQPDPASLVDKLTLCEKRDAELMQQIKKSETIVVAVRTALDTAGLDSDSFSPEELEAKLTEAMLLYSSIDADRFKVDASEPADQFANIKAIAKQVNEMPRDIAASIPDEPTTFEECKGRLSTIKGQYSKLQEIAQSKGHGSDHPSCWYDSQGHEEFIASVMLTSAGFIAQDRKLPRRAAEQAKLPLEGVVWDAEVDFPKFQSMMGQLLKWSKQQKPECRFFVLVYDQTPAGNKLLYKKRLRQVGQVFYPHEPNPELGSIDQ